MENICNGAALQHKAYCESYTKCHLQYALCLLLFCYGPSYFQIRASLCMLADNSDETNRPWKYCLLLSVLLLFYTMIHVLNCQATARWWDTNGLGDASVYLYPLFTRLALSEYDAHLSVPLWCALCHCAFTASLWHWFQSTLRTFVPSLRSSCI